MNCPIDDVEYELLQEAMSHDNYHQFVLPRRCDGYFTREQFSVCVSLHSDPRQCECSANSAIFSNEYPTDVLTDIKELVRSPPRMLTQDVGLRFIIALLQRLFSLFGIEVAPAGRGYGVSYILFKNNQRYHFCGHPDFVIL